MDLSGPLAPAAGATEEAASRRPARPGRSWLRVVGASLVVGVLAVSIASARVDAAEASRPAAVVTHGPSNLPRIALTFDDNFYPSRSLATIAVLEAYDVPATMFVVGNYVTGYQDITQAIASGGFEVGDHSMTHASLDALPWASLVAEVGGGTTFFEEMTGKAAAPLLRPPFGHVNGAVTEAAGARGFEFVVLWDVDSSDWKGLSAETIRNHVLREAHNGAIVLMHMSAPHTAEALPGIITELRRRGYELVTVSKLLEGGRRFRDVVEGTASGQAVLRMVNDRFMSGYSQDAFGPADHMTRAQLAKVAVLVADVHTPELETRGSPTFSDVPLLFDSKGIAFSYPFDYVEESVAAGMLSGRTSTVFDPNAPVTRVQIAQVLARMAREIKGYPMALGPVAGLYPDAPDYAAADLDFVAGLGLVQGYSNGLFDPWSSAQRAHVALVMTRFLDLPPYQAPPITTTTTAMSTTSTTLPTITSTTLPAPTSSTTTTTEPKIVPPTTTTTTVVAG